MTEEAHRVPSGTKGTELVSARALPQLFGKCRFNDLQHLSFFAPTVREVAKSLGVPATSIIDTRVRAEGARLHPALYDALVEVHKTKSAGISREDVRGVIDAIPPAQVSTRPSDGFIRASGLMTQLGKTRFSDVRQLSFFSPVTEKVARETGIPSSELVSCTRRRSEGAWLHPILYHALVKEYHCRRRFSKMFRGVTPRREVGADGGEDMRCRLEDTFLPSTPQSKSRIAVKRARVSLHVPCVDCGESRLSHLAFAHFDPQTKAFNVSSASSFQQLLDEVAKTRSLCYACHWKADGSKEDNSPCAMERNDALFDDFDGRCQVDGCEFRVTTEDIARPWKMQVVNWVLRDPALPAPGLSALVHTQAPVAEMMAAMHRRIPVCHPHARVIRNYRMRADPKYVVERGAKLPQECTDAFNATTDNPGAWYALTEARAMVKIFAVD